MGKAISALGSASGSAGSALGSAASNVVSPVIVQAASKGASSALGSTLGRAIGAGVSGLGSGIGSAAGQAAAQPTPQAPAANENMVDAVTVTAPRLANTPAPPSSLGSSLIPSVLGALNAGSLASYAAPAAQAQPLANTSTSTEVSPIEVTAAMQGSDAGSGLAGALGGGLGDVISGAESDANLYDMDPESDDQILDENGEGVDAKDAGMLALLAGLGLKPKDLLGMGLLGAGMLTAGGKGGGDGGGAPGTPAGELTSIATQNRELANMMSQRAQAGLSGQIGGMGMNAIKRMVRNAQAAIRQRYAGMGMSGSTAETADLNAAAESGVDMQFRIGQQTAQSGLNAVAALTGQSANIYQALMNAQTQKDTQLGNALANFAGAVGGRLLAG